MLPSNVRKLIVVFDFEGECLDSKEIEEITGGANVERKTFLDRPSNT